MLALTSFDWNGRERWSSAWNKRTPEGARKNHTEVVKFTKSVLSRNSNINNDNNNNNSASELYNALFWISFLQFILDVNYRPRIT
jgi:hypothetical protein